MNALELEYLLTLPGWCNAPKMKRMNKLCREVIQKDGVESKDIISVECGTFAGRSAFPLALAHKEAGIGYTLTVDAWDNTTPLEGSNAPLNNEYWAALDMDIPYDAFLKGVMKLKVRGYCRWLQGRSDVASRLFDDNSISIIHIDGNHNVETITKELELWTPKLKSGAYLIADDVLWPEAAPGYAKLPDFGFLLFEDHHEWQIWIKE